MADAEVDAEFLDICISLSMGVSITEKGCHHKLLGFATDGYHTD